MTTLPRRGILALSLAFVLATLLSPAPVWARGVSVNKKKVVVVRRTFDPGDPPPEMPPLGPDADAITHLKFGCATRASYEPLGQRQERGGYVSSARITEVGVELELQITIWVPTGARQKLIDHEEGHRAIGERVYERAEQVAKEEAQKLIGRTVTGRAKTRAAAAADAVKSANHDFCEAYHRRTAEWAERVGTRYDEITSHGRRSRPTVEEAIEQAFAKEPQEEGREETRRQGDGETRR